MQIKFINRFVSVGFFRPNEAKQKKLFEGELYECWMTIGNAWPSHKEAFIGSSFYCSANSRSNEASYAVALSLSLSLCRVGPGNRLCRTNNLNVALYITWGIYCITWEMWLIALFLRTAWLGLHFYSLFLFLFAWVVEIRKSYVITSLIRLKVVRSWFSTRWTITLVLTT